MQMTSINTAGNSLDDQHLDAVKAVQEARGKEDELNLDESAPKYFRLYEKGMSEDKLVVKLVDKRGKENGADYFNDPDQLKKARSYARNIMAHYKQFAETKFEDMSMNEKVSAFSTLSEEQRKEFTDQIVA